MKISLVLGIDIGGTNTIYGFITKDGTIVFQEEIPTNGDKSISDLVDRIGKRVENFFYKNPQYILAGIGIGAPNGNHYTGKIQSPPNLSWGDVDIVKLFIPTYKSRYSNTYGCVWFKIDPILKEGCIC